MRLDVDNTQSLYWYIDSSFVVHYDMKIYTVLHFLMGKGDIEGESTKQKVNTRRSTESELQGVVDKIVKVLWCKRFLQAQGFEVKLNLVYKDNTSRIKLEENGKASSGKRTRNFYINMFYVTDIDNRK